MKKFFTLVVLALLAVGCAKEYDDSGLRELINGLDARISELETNVSALQSAVGDGVRVLSVSSVDGTGLGQVADYALPGRTIALIGSSGVGKSTLVNRLAGEERQATQEIQEWSGRGRHTTTLRELVMLPSGAMVIDTPGLREIGRVGEAELLQAKGESTHRRRK